MKDESLWKSYSRATGFDELRGNLTVDVAIIGGGITGLTAGQLLSEQGLKVAIIERDRVGYSNTAHSTGNLYSAYGDLLTQTVSKHGLEKVQKILASRAEGIDFIEKNISRFEIDCDFQRVPWFYYTALPENQSIIEVALTNGARAGLPVSQTELPDSRLRSLFGLKVDGQAQFNPLLYSEGLARAISGDHCLIFEGTKVEEIQESAEQVVLKTTGGDVTAKYLIHATHTPKGIEVGFQANLGPYREYGIAFRIRSPQHPPGIYFGYHNHSDITSTRLYERGGESYLIVVGEPHKVGQGDSLYHIKKLEEFAHEHFEVESVAYRWGGQHYRPSDLVPYIGRKTGKSNTFVATGFSTHGLVYGTVAAGLISDEIMGRENAFAEIYDSTRFSPMKSAPKFIKENVNVFVQYLKDYAIKHNEPFADVAVGEGKVLDFDGHKLAAYRDEHEDLQVCSAICTHMGCVVHWNNAEKSWDCPCHGSRFDTQGEVIEGPALKALDRVENVLDVEEKGTRSSIFPGASPQPTT